MRSPPPDRIAVEWRPRAVPLEPVAVAARGPAARALGRRLLALSDVELERLSGAAGAGCLVVVRDRSGGFPDPPQLPWVDGAEYLGAEPEARGLLLPTALEPALPAPLLVDAARRRGVEPPLAILVVHGPALIPLVAARALHRQRLEIWTEQAG